MHKRIKRKNVKKFELLITIFQRKKCHKILKKLAKKMQ